MKLLRSKFTSKFLAVFFLLIIIESTVQSTLTYALTTGPHQPEYTSYEEPGATDMVNLLTGDFTFSLPLLDVPSPEGAFSVPLTYNAGIGLEQEASWTGLGWTLNVGAITRNIVQFPDDASKEVQSVTNRDLIGVRGWTSSALGLGQIGWNTEQGHYGVLSILGIVNISYDKSGTTVGVAGLNVGPNGISFDATQFMVAAFSIGMMGVGTALEMTIGQQVAIQAGVGAGLSFASPSQTPNAPTDGYWEYSKRTQSGFLNLWEDYWIWLDQTRYEEMQGILNLDQASTTSYAQDPNLSPLAASVNSSPVTLTKFSKPANNKGSASDISYYIPMGKTYREATSPVALATDNYSVKAPGISGSIKPYRLDVGSVSMPREMTKQHDRFAPIAFKPHKVPFMYEGSISNTYFNHLGELPSTGTVGQVTTPTFYNGLSGVLQSTDPAVNNLITLTLNDKIFDNNYRIRPDAVNNGYKLPASNHVEWLTNNEIATQANSFPSGFMDYFQGSDRNQFRTWFDFGKTKSVYTTSSNFTDGVLVISPSDLVYFQLNNVVNLTIDAYATEGGDTYTTYNTSGIVTAINPGASTVTVSTTNFGSNVAGKYCGITAQTPLAPKRDNSIGGYSITSVDGMTYHFALPSYEHSNFTRINNKDNPTTKYQTITRDEPFANTWLLTGVTGTDFVDRNNNGVIDEGDWGFWVKFNYGKYSDNYNWRIPFQGATLDAANTSTTYSEGGKQIHYLNSIETRSHVALFLKNDRLDNKDALLTTNSALRLDEIALITKDVYKQLSTTYGLDFSQTFANRSKVWKMSDFYAPSGSNHPAQGTYLLQNCIKRIKFTYTYELCKNTPNSTDVNKGKLTLKRVSLLGKNNALISPDYKFDYGFNPDYSQNSWDGWGMYNSMVSTMGHKSSTNHTDGFAWSLNKITNPLGSTIEIEYERDTYGSISGNLFNNYRAPNYEIGDRILISGKETAMCPSVQICTDQSGLEWECPGLDQEEVVNSFTIPGSVIENFVVVPDQPIPTYVSQNYNCVNYPYGSNITVVSPIDYYKLINDKFGGNVRVKTLKLNDAMGQSYLTRYLYKLDNESTSGVVAQEPEYIRDAGHEYTHLPGYPMTPVMYSKVTVLSGKLTNNLDYHTKQVYEFEVPNQNQIVNNNNSTNSFVRGRMKIFPENFYYDFLSIIKNEISDYTSKIGKLKSSKLYDRSNQLISSTDMQYSSTVYNAGSSSNNYINQYQGIFSESTVMFDRLIEQTNEQTWTSYLKTNRTSILKYPYVLQKVINSKNGQVSTTENKAWDFISGLVVDKIDVSPMGKRVRTVTKPAYTFTEYAQMGAKALNANNKNMLAQEGASYSYAVDATGANIGLLSASAQTWKKDWNNYRYLSGVTYTQGVEGPDVWRKNKTYIYKGNYSELRTDGTGSLNFTPSKEFSYAAAATNLGWMLTSEVTRYDHYSAAIEGKDFNQIYAASKKDINNQLVLASATNATYFEFAYSGAEDWTTTSAFFGGEVAKGDATVVYKTPTGTETHTGKVAVQLAANGKSFKYNPVTLTSNRTYRVSAWTNSLNGAIYYRLNGATTDQVIPATASKQVGAWYQINAEINVPAFTSLEVGVKSLSGTVRFDDFRFQPRDGSLNATVYDPITGAVTHVLDNQNMFTMYEYNDAGQIVKTYSESFMYGVKLTSESKTNFRRFYTNP